jgi:hypothetical protein
MKTFANGYGHWATIKEVHIDNEDWNPWYELKINNGHSLDCSFYRSEASAMNALNDFIRWVELDGE